MSHKLNSACVGAHHLSRQLRMLGHDARLMPARYVRPQAPSRAVVQANTPFRRGKVGSFALAPIVLSLEAALSLSFCLDCAADARPLAQ
jgi:hypothetical protein